MKKTTRISNALNLHFSLDFLEKVFNVRMGAKYEKIEQSEKQKELLLEYYEDGSICANFLESYRPNFDEYVIFLLALSQHIQPGFIDKIIQENISESGNFSEIGGTRDKDNRRFMPTGETALFLLAGENLERRFEVQTIFTAEHWFAKENILRLETAKEGEPFWSGRLLLNPEYIELFTRGQVSTPIFSSNFPAREITTDLEWDDIVLRVEVREQIEDIKKWIEYNEVLLKEWKMYKVLKPGYRALFYGPSGVGKTLTATLLGKYTSRPVFRIDLSSLVSKYIGETEKNLSSLFEKARNKRWILFFDEADSLFGKRTNIKDAHDRYANQEVSYLLQEVEEFNGLVILCSNFKANLDDAFLRRFNAIVRFDFPSEPERAEIIRKSLPGQAKFEKGVDFASLIAKFELTGGNIINVVQHACIEAIARNSDVIKIRDALKGVKLEVEKEGKVFKNIIENELY
jgi:AAA+ superfamily predicted ATPase